MRIRLICACGLFIIATTCTLVEVSSSANARSAAPAAALSSHDLSILRGQAEAGDAAAQYELGRAYFAGNGVPKDTVHGSVLLRKAAKQGSAQAQRMLGWAYARGEGVPKDAVKAAIWWQKAADQGNAGARYSLALAYLHGNGVPKDEIKAVTLIQQSADQGYAKSQTALGSAYLFGVGVSQDRDSAIAWFQKAAGQGEAHAISYLGQLASELRRQQVAHPSVSAGASYSRPRAAMDCDSGHWVDGVTEDGEIVKLEDGSVWRVDPGDNIDSALWLPAAEIIVCDEELINVDDNEKVGATRIN